MAREPITITMADVRCAKICSYGARAYCKTYGIDWSSFLRNGISSTELEATNDAKAMQVVEAAYGRR